MIVNLLPFFCLAPTGKQVGKSSYPLGGGCGKDGEALKPILRSSEGRSTLCHGLRNPTRRHLDSATNQKVSVRLPEDPESPSFLEFSPEQTTANRWHQIATGIWAAGLTEHDCWLMVRVRSDHFMNLTTQQHCI